MGPTGPQGNAGTPGNDGGNGKDASPAPGKSASSTRRSPDPLPSDTPTGGKSGAPIAADAAADNEPASWFARWLIVGGTLALAAVLLWWYAKRRKAEADAFNSVSGNADDM
ncbi:hypothetical protein ACFQYP_00640 [Nonomuraea antimicrobica]